MSTEQHPTLNETAPPAVQIPNPVGPIATANANRNLIQERNEESARDRNQVAKTRSRFEARRNPLTPAKRDSDPNVETLILTTAAHFPAESYCFPAISTFVPNSSVMLYIAQYMDYTMSATKRWTDNCAGWAPPYTQIYLSVLFYIQTMRAMESAGALPATSELNFLLKNLTNHYVPENLWIPGPLVQYFKNLSCFWPSSTERFGNVTPALPPLPGWSRDSRYAFEDVIYQFLPNISMFISRCHAVCAAATRDGANESTFLNDVDGPRFCATLFSQPCVNDNEFEMRNVTSPGSTFVLAGDLRLWQNAANRLAYNGFPPDLDVNETVVNDTWSSALRMTNSHTWFGPMTAMMAKYCQFWRGSVPLSDCAPNCSAAGGVTCNVEVGTDLFDDVPWIEPTGTHNNTQHGNANQTGHYSFVSIRDLILSARTTIEDLPDAFFHAAITFCPNLIVNDDDIPIVREGDFWNVAPAVAGRDHVSVLQGALASVVRDYHCDSRLDAQRN